MAVRRKTGIGVAFVAVLALGLGGAPALADSHMAGESEAGKSMKGKMDKGMKGMEKAEEAQGASEKASLQGKVASKLAREEGLAGVHAKAKEGMVTLRGKVANEAERDRAEEIVRGVEGVETVKNEIEIDVASPPAEESGGGGY